MKIIHIITRMILGGAQENTLFTCEGLHRRGHEVILITGPTFGPEGQLVDRAHAGGYQVIELDTLRREISPILDYRACKSLEKIIRELNPDIIHTHSSKAGILGRTAAASVRTENIEKDCCCAAVRNFKQAQAQSCSRPKIVHTIHGLAFHPYEKWWKNKIYITSKKYAAKFTDKIISVAQAMTDQALAAGIGRPEQYTKIFSGLDTSKYLAEHNPQQIRDEFNIPADAIVIATVARLFELKGHEYLIQAAQRLAAKHPKAIWLFIGDGNLRPALEQQIAAANLQNRFRLTGLVSPDRIPELLHASDILAHCSLREGLARALPQALLCGKPVISFDVDGAREVVINDRTGCLIPPQDINALTEALDKLITNPDLRVKLGQAGKELCRQEFDHELMVDRIESVYKELCPTLPEN